MRNTIKRNMTVAVLSSVAALTTGANAATTAGIAPFDLEPRGPRVPKKEQPAEPKSEQPAKPQFPQPQNGVIEGVSLSTLNTIAACESGGDPTAVNAAGYFGKYQFDLQTWAAVGGSGNPAKAPEAEQDYRAALLYSQSGSSPWPVCGV